MKIISRLVLQDPFIYIDALNYKKILLHVKKMKNRYATTDD